MISLFIDLAGNGSCIFDFDGPIIYRGDFDRDEFGAYVLKDGKPYRISKEMSLNEARLKVRDIILRIGNAVRLRFDLEDTVFACIIEDGKWIGSGFDAFSLTHAPISAFTNQQLAAILSIAFDDNDPFGEYPIATEALAAWPRECMPIP